MSAPNTTFMMLLAFVFGAAVVASQYASAPVAPGASYGASPDIVALGDLSEARARAESSGAAANAAASKIDNVRRAELDRYGHEIGRPLLARPYGALTGLYAAALPPRSLVGKIDPAFEKDSYGRVNYVGESLIAVAVI